MGEQKASRFGWRQGHAGRRWGWKDRLGQVPEDSSATHWQEAKDVTDQKMTESGLRRSKVSQAAGGRQAEEGPGTGLLQSLGQEGMRS